MTAAPRPTGLRFRGWWIALGVAMVGTVIAASLLNVRQPLPVAGGDKVGHMLAYTALAWWWGMVQPRRRLVWGIGFIALGGALEWAQSFSPWRHMDWLDFGFNTVGVLLGMALLATPACRLLSWLDRQVGNRLDAGPP